MNAGTVAAFEAAGDTCDSGTAGFAWVAAEVDCAGSCCEAGRCFDTAEEVSSAATISAVGDPILLRLRKNGPRLKSSAYCSQASICAVFAESIRRRIIKEREKFHKKQLRVAA